MTPTVLVGATLSIGSTGILTFLFALRGLLRLGAPPLTSAALALAAATATSYATYRLIMAIYRRY